jgi:hypothetical protein
MPLIHFFWNCLKVLRFRFRNLFRKETLQEKIRYKMAWDRNPELRVLTDKYLVRDFVRATVGEEYLVPIIWAGGSVKDIPWSQLPRQFVVRVTHGSGGVFLVTERAARKRPAYRNLAGRWTRFEVHPDYFEPTEIEKVLESWLKLRYEFRKGKPPAWAYGRPTPRIIIESFVGEKNKDLSELKCFCINGEVRFLKLLVGNLSKGKGGCYYTPEWKHIPVLMSEGGKLSRSIPVGKQPACLSEAIQVSQDLAKRHDFVRVDLLIDNNKIFFGELTFYPQGGNFEFDPPSYSQSFADGWKQSLFYCSWSRGTSSTAKV